MPYGDTDRASTDIKTLHDIIRRQGVDILLHVIAEHIGLCNQRWNLSQVELDRVKAKMTDELVESINERT